MKLTKLKTPLLLVILYLSLPVFLMVTNPDSLPLVFLVVPILLVFVGLFATVYVTIGLMRPNQSKRKRRIISALLAALPTMLFLLQSINQLSLRDLIIVIVLWSIMGWYLLKIDFA